MKKDQWRKSSYSGMGGGDNNECVEVAVSTETVGVRDTKDRAAGHLTVSPAAWAAFTRTAR
ncbi:DUF397 domain-containing protein [Amycolatopsis minnesotensis]|uniref:DUF397 domain-containing protein n=1 Tax=Amycolatopsis minnesotensis TaxID=337894 RepID=A0ABP5BKI0_9PSEU